MSKTVTVLTAKEVEALAKQPGMHAVEAGLFLQVRGNTQSWIHRYQFEKQSRYSGLGAYPAATLAQARAKLKAEQAQLEQGIDPVAERKRQRNVEKTETARTRKTFKEVAKTYITDNEASWKNPVHRKQWPSSLETYVYSVAIDGERKFGDLYVDEIATDHVVTVLRPIWYEKAETARRVRGRIEKILGSAKALGLRSGENPAALADNIALVLPRKRGDKKTQMRHHPALPYAEMPALMTELRAQESTSAKALEFVILTGVRTGDIIGQDYEERPPMMWPHVDLDAKLWTIPATKNDGAHTVPLSDAAIAVLRSVVGLDSVIVFPSPDRKGEPLSNNAMLALLDRMGRGDVTVHGMRSTFRDWVGEETNFPRELAEKAIQHTIGDETERAYQRGELLKRRRKLMEAWASYCASPPGNATCADDNVVVLRQSA